MTMNMQNPYEGLIKTIDVILRKAELEDGKTLAFLITELPLSDEPVSPAIYIKFFQRLKESGAIKDFSVMEMGRRPHAFTLIQPNKGKLLKSCSGRQGNIKLGFTFSDCRRRRYYRRRSP